MGKVWEKRERALIAAVHRVVTAFLVLLNFPASVLRQKNQ